jgi:hypothetical protein
MRFYQPILALAAMCLLPIAMAKAGAIFVLETTYDAAGSKSSEQTRMSIDGSNVMVDMDRSKGGGGGGAPDQFIFLGKSGEMMVIDHAEKSYMVMDKESLKAMRAMMGMAGGKSGSGGEAGAMSDAMEAIIQEALKDLPEDQRAEAEKAMREQMGGKKPDALKKASPVEYRKTKERDKQQGFPCVKYVATQDGAVIREMWVTDWDNIDGGEEARDAFKAMAAFWQEAFGDMAQMTGENPIELFEKVDGFPVITREMTDGKVDSESILKSATEADVDPASFKPPAGYKPKKMGSGE